MCVNCYNVNSNKISLLTDKPYRGLHEIVCSKCDRKWLVCTLHNHRWSQSRYKIAEKHIRIVHHNIVEPDFCNFNSNNNDIDVDNASNDNLTQLEVESNSDTHVDDIRLSNIATEDDVFHKFLASQREVSLDDYNETVKRYITCESRNVGDGLKRIVCFAFTMNPNCGYSQVSINELKYHLKAAIFSCSLTSSQKSNFGELCYLMLNTFMDKNTVTDHFHCTRIAVSSKEVDRYYLKRSSSIVENVPIPSIEEFDDHAYVVIKEIVQYFLYFEIPLDGMLTERIDKNYKQLMSSSSKMSTTNISNLIRMDVKNSLENEHKISPLIITIVLWSDDFEPNNVKQHKKSTWIKTITLSPPLGYQTSPEHTFVIALGPKEKNHENVNKRIFNELKELQKPTYMYCKSTNSNIPVVIKVLAISADRPERSSLNCMLGHNGISSKRWRYSAYVNQHKLKSCKSCIRKRLQSLNSASMKSKSICYLCYDWNYNHPSMKEPKPDNYPSTQHPDSPPAPLGREVLHVKYLHPIELTYQKMIEGVNFCFFNCYHGYWTKSSAMVYLKSIGINESYGNKFVYQKAIECKGKDHITETSLFKYIEYPVHWTSGISLD